MGVHAILMQRGVGAYNRVAQNGGVGAYPGWALTQVSMVKAVVAECMSVNRQTLVHPPHEKWESWGMRLRV